MCSALWISQQLTKYGMCQRPSGNQTYTQEQYNTKDGVQSYKFLALSHDYNSLFSAQILLCFHSIERL